MRGRIFRKSVRKHADSIAKKYILPDEDTLDIALMFVPSEGVYYELLRSEISNGSPLDEYCRSKGVIAVSPNTLFAHLRVILMGLRGMQIEENAKRILSDLTGLKKQIENFSDVYERLGAHLRNAQQSYSDADRKLERARNTLDEMAQGAPALSRKRSNPLPPISRVTYDQGIVSRLVVSLVVPFISRARNQLPHRHCFLRTLC